MSIRSFIGKKTKAGITGIYCDYAGYPEGVGETLQYSYESLKKVNALLRLGNLVKLRPHLSQTIAYTRDYGEPRKDPLFYETEAALRQGCQEMNLEFAYVFDSGQWTTLVSPEDSEEEDWIDPSLEASTATSFSGKTTF
jgi:hypothetical protein